MATTFGKGFQWNDYYVGFLFTLAEWMILIPLRSILGLMAAMFGIECLIEVESTVWNSNFHLIFFYNRMNLLLILTFGGWTILMPSWSIFADTAETLGIWCLTADWTPVDFLIGWTWCQTKPIKSWNNILTWKTVELWILIFTLLYVLFCFTEKVQARAQTQARPLGP